MKIRSIFLINFGNNWRILLVEAKYYKPLLYMYVLAKYNLAMVTTECLVHLLIEKLTNDQAALN